MGQVLITHLLTWFKSCVVTGRKSFTTMLPYLVLARYPAKNIFVLIQSKMYLAISLTVNIVPSDMWRVTIYLFFMHLEPHTSNECIFNRFDIEIRAHDFYPLKMILYLKNVLSLSFILRHYEKKEYFGRRYMCILQFDQFSC